VAVSDRLAEIKAKCERLEAQLAGDFPFAVDDVSWLVAEIERLRASLEKMHTRSDERDDAIEREAFEEAAKIAEDGWESPEAIAAAIRAKAEEVQGT